MRKTKIVMIAGAAFLCAVATLAGMRKPRITTLTKVYYTHGGESCPFFMLITTIQFTTNGDPGGGVQATIRTVGNISRKLWGFCLKGVGSHPAHMHP